MRLSEKIAQSPFFISEKDEDRKYIVPHLPGVYKFTNLVNGKIYVGMGMNLYTRLSSYDQELKSKQERPIIRAINKYGWENFKLEILETFPSTTPKTIVLDREVFWISMFQSLDTELGYNVILRSSTYKSSPRKKCLNKGRKPGFKLTELNKKKISESMLGDKHYARRIGFTEEHKKNLSIAGYRRVQLPESRKKISESKKKPVEQYNLETGETVRLWKSMTDAAIELYGDILLRSRIALVIIGYRDSYKGFGWRRAKNEIV